MRVCILRREEWLAERLLHAPLQHGQIYLQRKIGQRIDALRRRRRSWEQTTCALGPLDKVVVPAILETCSVYVFMRIRIHNLGTQMCRSLQPELQMLL